ncbi:MAG: rRNA adenine dimethyltransferase family protein [Patescibacteria group bacterium]
MDILQQTKQLCAKYQIKPARSRGQNFLIAEKIYQKIIEAAELKSNDVILEVGPGLGFLTEMLAKKVKRVIAVELDNKLAEVLTERFQKEKVNNIVLINKDILKITNDEFYSVIASEAECNGAKCGNPVNSAQMTGLLRRPDPEYSGFGTSRNDSYKIVANLPYNITSRFLRKFLSEMENKPSEMVLMLQQEVAERICAAAGQMSLLAVSAQFYATPKIIARVPAGVFWPSPKVDSAIIKLRTLPTGRQVKNYELRIKEKDEQKLFKLVKIGFSAKRKQLAGNLIKNLKIKREEITKILTNCGLKETVRAQELSLDDWQRLFVVLDRQNML